MAAPKKSTAVARSTGTTAVSTQTASALAAEMEAMRQRLAAQTGDKVKVDNKQFKLPNGDTSDLLTAIIVDFVYTYNYYEGDFDANNIVPPNCFAIYPDPSGAVPSDNSPDKQCEDCGRCWANQFGSKGKGKACRNGVLMAILPPDATAETPLMTINVSSTALKPFTGYASSVARALNYPLFGVTTDLSCDPSVKYDTLRFSNPQPLDEDMIALVMARRDEARQRLLVEPDVSQLAAQDTPAAQKPKQAGRVLKPAAKPARRTA